MKKNELSATEPTPASAMAIMASRCNVDPKKLHHTLKNTVFKKATDEEMLALVVTANTYQLNPLLKELHAFPNKSGGIVPVVGIDGWLKIINRQESLDGMTAEFSDDSESCTVTIHLKDRKHPVVITEYLEECRRNSEPWKTMPRRMLRHKAIMQAGRVAFGISGIYDEDEARDISMRNVTPDTPPTPTSNPFKTERQSEPVVDEAEPLKLEAPEEDDPTLPVVDPEVTDEDGIPY